MSAPQEFVSGYYTNGDSRWANLLNHQYEWGDTLNWSKGHHQIKTGFNVIYSSSGGYGQEFGSGYIDGRFQINSKYQTIPIATLLTYNPSLPPPGSPKGAPPIASSFTQSFGNANYNIKETLYGMFVQDNWTVRPNFTLEPRPALRRTDLHQPVRHVLAARRVCLAVAARHGDPRRLRHLLLGRARRPRG